MSVNHYVSKADEYPGRLLSGSPKDISSSLVELKNKHTSFCLEIGSGSGAHLISRAEANLGVGHIGVELRFKRAVRTIEKARSDNLYVVREKVENIWPGLRQLKFDSVFVNFPDPWPRRKSWKHRLLSGEQLQFIRRLLASSGSIELKSDHLDYFNWAKRQLEVSNDFDMEHFTHDFYSEVDWESFQFKSEFEQLFYYQNLKINYLRARAR